MLTFEYVLLSDDFMFEAFGVVFRIKQNTFTNPLCILLSQKVLTKIRSSKVNSEGKFIKPDKMKRIRLYQ